MYLLILIENGKHPEACRARSLIFNLSLLPFCFVLFFTILYCQSVTFLHTMFLKIQLRL